MRPMRAVVLVLVPLMCAVSCSREEVPGEASAGQAPASSKAAEPTAPGSTAATTSSTPAWTGPTIPDGAYAKTATRAEAKAAGVMETLDDFGKGASVTYTYKFSGDRWTIFITTSGSAPEPGDNGTLAYAPGKQVSMTSESEGCPQCVYTYRWRETGERLRLTIVGHESTDSPEQLAAVRFITEGVFTRQQ